MSGLTDVAGLTVGHAHDFDALTGVMVVLCPTGAVAGVGMGSVQWTLTRAADVLICERRDRCDDLPPNRRPYLAALRARAVWEPVRHDLADGCGKARQWLDRPAFVRSWGLSLPLADPDTIRAALVAEAGTPGAPPA